MLSEEAIDNSFCNSVFSAISNPEFYNIGRSKDDLKKFSEPFFYKAYAIYLSGQTSILDKYTKLKRTLSLIQEFKGNARYVCIACSIAQDKKAWNIVRSLYRKYYDEASKQFISSAYQRSSLNFQFDTEKQEVFDKCIRLLFLSENKPELMESIINGLTTSNSVFVKYIKNFEKHKSKIDARADAFFTPVLLAYGKALGTYRMYGVISAFTTMMETANSLNYPIAEDFKNLVYNSFATCHMRSIKFCKSEATAICNRLQSDIIEVKRPFPNANVCDHISIYKNDLIFRLEKPGKDVIEIIKGNLEPQDVFSYKIDGISAFFRIIFRHIALLTDFSDDMMGMIYGLSDKEYKNLLVSFFQKSCIRKLTKDDVDVTESDKSALLSMEDPFIGMAKRITDIYLSELIVPGSCILTTKEVMEALDAEKLFYKILVYFYSEYTCERNARNDIPMIDQETELIRRTDCLDRKVKELTSQLKEQSALDRQDAELKKTLKDLRNREHDLLSEIKTLQEQVYDLHKEKKELSGLRELFYSLEQEDSYEEPETEDYETMVSVLQEYKGVVIGGHNNMQTKLGQTFQDWKIYNEKAAIPSTVLCNADFVVMMSDHMSHTQYYNAISVIRENNCKLIYVHKTNLPGVVDTIYRNIERG